MENEKNFNINDGIEKHKILIYQIADKMNKLAFLTVGQDVETGSQTKLKVVVSKVSDMINAGIDANTKLDELIAAFNV